MTEHAAAAVGADRRAESRAAKPRRANDRSTLAWATVPAATLMLSAAAWAVTVRRLDGMDMGVTTELGSLGSFTVMWVWMMTAMMVPGAVPSLVHRARQHRSTRSTSWFVATYLGVWALLGPAVYAVYRPHGTVAAGVMVIVAGGYELTPLKRHFRHRCRDETRSGFAFGVSCVGSSAGLMLLLAALGIMSVAWMIVVAVVVLAQKLWAARLAIDVPIAAAIVGLGLLILIAPSAVPGLAPTM